MSSQRRCEDEVGDEASHARDIRRIAIEAYGSDDVWFDSDAEVVQAGMEGYWVVAQVWVPMEWTKVDATKR